MRSDGAPATLLSACAFGCSIAALLLPWFQECSFGEGEVVCQNIGIVLIGGIKHSEALLLSFLAPALLTLPADLCIRLPLRKARKALSFCSLTASVAGLACLCALSRRAAEAHTATGYRLLMPLSGWYLALAGLVVLIASSAAATAVAVTRDNRFSVSGGKARAWCASHVMPIFKQPDAKRYGLEVDSAVGDFERNLSFGSSFDFQPPPLKPPPQQQQPGLSSHNRLDNGGSRVQSYSITASGARSPSDAALDAALSRAQLRVESQTPLPLAPDLGPAYLAPSSAPAWRHQPSAARPGSGGGHTSMCWWQERSETARQGSVASVSLGPAGRRPVQAPSGREVPLRAKFGSPMAAWPN